MRVGPCHAVLVVRVIKRAQARSAGAAPRGHDGHARTHGCGRPPGRPRATGAGKRERCRVFWKEHLSAFGAYFYDEVTRCADFYSNANLAGEIAFSSAPRTRPPVFFFLGGGGGGDWPRLWCRVL